MSLIVGNYQHERNENLENYYKAVGIPLIPRKMMMTTSPSMVVSIDEQGEWTIRTTTIMRTHVAKFKIGEEYEESMPGNVVLKNIASKEGDNKLVIISTTPDGVTTTRIYEFSETGVVITLKHDPSGIEGKRYFKRVK